MKWYEKVNEDARVAYLLTLTEKVMDKLADYEWYYLVKESIDMYWEWVEEKKHSGDALYETVDNEEEDGLLYIEGVAFVGESAYGPQADLVWSCAVDAIIYTARQAYKYENDVFPQPVEIATNEYMGEEFMGKIRQVEGYQEEWTERLKQYLLENYPAGSDQKIKKDEILSQI